MMVAIRKKKSPMTFIYKLKTGVMDIQANSEIATWKSSLSGSLEPAMVVLLREVDNGKAGNH